MTTDDASPAGQRRADARRRVELAEQGARAEAEQAQRLVDEFVEQARRHQLTPVPLRARLVSGAQDVRTDKQGWYLRKDRSIAIGTDGGYYQLTVPGGAMARFTGVKLQPSPPPMVIGRGGRDGETGDLAQFLSWRLDPSWKTS